MVRKIFAAPLRLVGIVLGVAVLSFAILASFLLLVMIGPDGDEEFGMKHAGRFGLWLVEGPSRYRLKRPQRDYEIALEDTAHAARIPA